MPKYECQSWSIRFSNFQPNKKQLTDKHGKLNLNYVKLIIKLKLLILLLIINLFNILIINLKIK